MPIFYNVTPSRCYESGNCEETQPCVPKPGECVYYSSTYLSGPNIQNGDNFNTVTIKLANYIATLVSNTGGITSAINLGGGSQVYAQIVGTQIQFRTLIAGSNIILTQSAARIQIDSTAIGGSDTAINVGAGVPIFKTKAGSEFQFRTVIGEDLIIPSQVGDEVKIIYDNKDRFNLVADASRFYPEGTYIEKIIINPGATISSFKIGTTPGNDDIVLEQPIAGLTYTTLIVEKLLGADTTLYIEGINSSTSFIVFKEFVQL